MRKAGKVYVRTIILAGLPVFAYSLHYSLVRLPLDWWHLVLLVTVGSFFPIRIPLASDDGKRQAFSMTVTDIFVFWAMIAYGPEACVVINGVEGLVTNVRGSIRSVEKQLFNFSELSIVAFVVGHLFFGLLGTTAPATADRPVLFAIVLGTSCLTYYLLNTSSVAGAVSFATGTQFWEVWRGNFVVGSLPTIAGAAMAGLLFFRFGEIDFMTLALASPLLLVAYLAYSINVSRVQSALDNAGQLTELYHSTIASLAMAIDAKDQCTHGHVHRVQTLALGLARRCGFDSQEQMDGLRAAALLHDIGKLAVPEYILNKPSGLTEWEMQKMRAHPTVGADILETVPFPYPVVPYVRAHHERWDGKGYPDGLSGEDIPMGARILSVADCYDALRSDRPYRQAMTLESTLEYIKAQSGKAYDPKIVDALCQDVHDIEAEIAAGEQQLPPSVLEHIEDAYGDKAADKKALTRTVFHDIASAHKEIQALYEISQSVGKSLNVSETTALLTEKIQKLVPYDACSIYLLNSETNRLVPYHTIGAEQADLEQVEVAMGDGVTGWVAANTQPISNVSPAPDFVQLRHLNEIFESCLGVPLVIEGRTLGVITLYSKITGAFSHDHLRLMETISRQAAVAINNSIIYEETQEDAYTDLLTGLPNLRYFRVFGEQELKRAARTGYPVSFLMMDLNAFKRINDRYGHRVGDRTLIEIAHILRNQMRKSDTCVRYGGDEFVAMLPGVNRQLVQGTIERIHQAINGHDILLDEDRSVQVGISVGSATFPDDGSELESLITLADQQMYRSKIVFRRKAKQKEKAASTSVLPFEKRRQK